MEPKNVSPTAFLCDQRKSVFIFVIETKFNITSLWITD